MKTWRMKKALCLLLAAVLMSALLPTPVFAADAEKKSVSGFYMDTIIGASTMPRGNRSPFRTIPSRS